MLICLKARFITHVFSTSSWSWRSHTDLLTLQLHERDWYGVITGGYGSCRRYMSFSYVYSVILLTAILSNSLFAGVVLPGRVSTSFLKPPPTACVIFCDPCLTNPSSCRTGREFSIALRGNLHKAALIWAGGHRSSTAIGFLTRMHVLVFVFRMRVCCHLCALRGRASAAVAGSCWGFPECLSSFFLSILSFRFVLHTISFGRGPLTHHSSSLSSLPSIICYIMVSIWHCQSSQTLVRDTTCELLLGLWFSRGNTFFKNHSSENLISRPTQYDHKQQCTCPKLYSTLHLEENANLPCPSSLSWTCVMLSFPLDRPLFSIWQWLAV